ncbi:hypothetical protein G7Y89_g9238 [Cudoniella acicularis]|uniref:F-box domain-containing protein n=1 Tax=Cudoniella acicularis TaxID=354080 RepID=A0A8H4W086_9HELO|nr:hypothetical protein G7Y89_g9238 [Cudoniella acicularis]
MSQVSAQTPRCQLPQQLILDIIFCCDVTTLKSIRLAQRSFNDLVEEYGHTVFTKIRHRIFTEEEADLFQLLDGGNPIRNLFVLEYRTETAKRLAAIGLENQQTKEPTFHGHAFGNIGAAEPKGDLARDYATVGWGILWRLSDIARIVVEAQGVRAGSQRRISSLTRGHPSIKLLEKTIRLNQLQYINTLSDRQGRGFFVMRSTVAEIFRDRVFDLKRVLEWGTGNEYSIRNSWLNWFVMRKGPRFFDKAWGGSQGNEECCKHITREWSKRTMTQILIEKTSAIEVEQALLKIFVRANLTTNFVSNLNGWARKDREIERVYQECSESGRGPAKNPKKPKNPKHPKASTKSPKKPANPKHPKAPAKNPKKPANSKHPKAPAKNPKKSANAKNPKAPGKNSPKVLSNSIADVHDIYLLPQSEWYKPPKNPTPKTSPGASTKGTKKPANKKPPQGPAKQSPKKKHTGQKKPKTPAKQSPKKKPAGHKSPKASAKHS